MTKALETKIRKAMKEAGTWRGDIGIRHYGNDYVIVWIEKYDEATQHPIWTDEARVYRKCETDIRNTFIGTIKADGTVDTSDIREVNNRW